MTQNLQRHKRDALDVRWKDFGVKEIERLGLIGGGWCCNVWSTHHFQKVPRRYRLPQCDGPRHPMRARAESQWFYRWRQAHDLSVRSGHVYIYTRTLISAFVFVVFFSLSLSSFSVSCVVSYMNRTWCRRRRTNMRGEVSPMSHRLLRQLSAIDHGDPFMGTREDTE